MTNLTDIQRVLLTTACLRDGGSLLPPPDSLGSSMPRVRRTIMQLIDMQLAAEVDTTVEASVWRCEGGRKVAAAISPAGRTAIGAASSQSPDADPAAPSVPNTGVTPRAGSKQALTVALLQRDNGASLADLIEATGWLPHTTRAALSGLRKRGLAVTRQKVDGTTRYQIAQAV